MPNYCTNKLEIKSDNRKQLKKFIKKVKNTQEDTDLSLDKIHPCPKELVQISSRNREIDEEARSKLVEKYGYSDWYMWRIFNWGTKWDIEAKLEYVDNDSAFYTFDSAWSPPTEWIRYAAKMFPDLEFTLKYDSPELGYMGICMAHGKYFQDKYINYPYPD